MMIELYLYPSIFILLSNIEEIPDRLYVEFNNWLPYNLMHKRIRLFKP